MVNSDRDRKLKLNIIFAYFLKGFTILSSFIIVPLYMSFLTKEQYGIWLTLSSFLTWVGFFELGLGNGLKNNLSESIATNNFTKGKEFVSTAYFYLFLITSVLLIVFLLINQYIPWNNIFHYNDGGTLINRITYIVFVAFIVNIYLRLIISSLHAIQETKLADSINVLANILVLLSTFIVVKFGFKPSLITVSIIGSWVPVFIFILSTVYFFNKQKILKLVSPGLTHINRKLFKPLMSVGIRFFVIQVSALLLYQTTNILIIKYFSTSSVVEYNIAYKYFSISHVSFAIILTPLWPAFSDAWFRKDTDWIKKKIKYLLFVWLFFLICVLLQFSIRNVFIPLWLGQKITLSTNLSLAIIVNLFLLSFGGIYNMFINATGKLNLQLICLLIGAVMFLPMSYFIVKILHFGVFGIILSSIICNFYSPFVAPIQYRKIITGTAKGIWNK